MTVAVMAVSIKKKHLRSYTVLKLGKHLTGQQTALRWRLVGLVISLVETNASMSRIGIGTICVEMNVLTYINNAMALALEYSKLFVEINASMRIIMRIIMEEAVMIIIIIIMAAVIMVTTPVEIKCNAMQCNAMVLALKIEFFAMANVYQKTTWTLCTLCVEMNVLPMVNNAMALALKTQLFVEIDASKRNILKDAGTMLTTPVEIVVIINLTHAMVLAMEIEFFVMVDVYQKQ